MGLYVSQKIKIWTPIWDPHGLTRASKIDPGAFKITVFDLPGSVYDSGDDFWNQKNDFVSILEAWALPNRRKNPKKSSLKIDMFFTLIFSWFGHGFGKVFLCFFDAFLSFLRKGRFHEKPCFSLVKSLFFKFGATKNHPKNALKTHSRKSSEKSASWSDFWRVLGARNP